MGGHGMGWGLWGGMGGHGVGWGLWVLPGGGGCPRPGGVPDPHPAVPPASLIRGNRANCALFSTNLDWLVSKLDRLEASSGQRGPLWGGGGPLGWGGWAPVGLKPLHATRDAHMGLRALARGLGTFLWG